MGEENGRLTGLDPPDWEMDGMGKDTVEMKGQKKIKSKLVMGGRVGTAEERQQMRARVSSPRRRRVALQQQPQSRRREGHCQL